MQTDAHTKLIYELGQGNVRVRIVETPYGYCGIEPVHDLYSLLSSKVHISHVFDLSDIDELVHFLLQAKTFLKQRCLMDRVSDTSIQEGQSNG